MTPLEHFNGTKHDAGMRRPYVLTVASHKGGTGRTTVALALAWIWGQLGRRVLLADADPNRSAALIAADDAGACRWPGVDFMEGMPALDRLPPPADVIVVDCPALTETGAYDVLRHTDGLVLTCLADTLCLRTLPTSTTAIRESVAVNPRLRLLGLVINLFDGADPAQVRLVNRIHKAGKPPLIGLPIPVQNAVRDWPLNPGSGFPGGTARAACLELAFSLQQELRLGSTKSAGRF
jgi:cellulose biosynthesis protein BcsQ